MASAASLFGRAARSPWTLQALATAAFVALVVWRFDVRAAVAPLRDAEYAWAALALAFAAFEKFIDTVRWRVYLAKLGRPPLAGLFGAFLIGNFGNNILPMRAGDLAKVQIVANRYGLPRAGLVSAVFMVESVLDGVTFLLLLFAGLALLDIGFVPAALLWGLAVTAGGGFVATTLASRFLPRELPPWRPFEWLAEPARRWLADAWPRFLDGLQTMREPSLLARALALNLAGWLTAVFTFWAFGLAFGLDLGFAEYTVIMIAANLVVAAPLTFQNIGTYEFVISELLAAWDIPREEALAYAAATHILTNLWVVALGLVALWAMRIRPRDLFALGRPQERRATETAPSPAPEEATT
ncbi:MAG TPA: lysylphosphatidylglycerol synthase transmembrane domain-containing protein [Dehalococcoidia bacterium]|nr:lysylphosphatidylglycerol synthase transmembrane domain-containing protein [Dehalococcoidia bacterium]